MKKTLFWIFVVVLMGSKLYAAGPRIFIPEDSYDFGVLVQGATVHHDFTIRNIGKSPLELHSIKTTCGCTAALPKQRVISPGQSTSVRVTFKSGNRVGNVHKQVLLRCNDVKNPNNSLHIKGLLAPQEHPPIQRSDHIFRGSCAVCHANHGRGKRGAELYRASCAMCHERHQWGKPTAAPPKEKLARMRKSRIHRSIADGHEGGMPAFHQAHEGPLSDRDISTLVRFLKRKKY